MQVRVGFTTIVAVFGAGGACGGKDGHAPRGEAKIASTCIPAGAGVVLTRIALTGSTFTFCVGARAGKADCFAADLDAKTIDPASAPADASSDRGMEMDVIFDVGASGGGPRSASIGPSARGKGLTACTHDKVTCHDLPIAAASIGDKPVAVSSDATLVAIDMRNPKDVRKSPGRVETWDAVTGKRLASFDVRYGPDHLGMEEVPRRGSLAFLGHTVLAFTVPGCALPCSSATMYSARGKHLGMLASDPTAASAEHFHDDVYVLHAYGPEEPFVVQDAATGKSVQLDADRNWAAVVTPDRIVRVVGLSREIDPVPRSPRVEVWGTDLNLVTTIAVPMCAPVRTASRGGP